MKNPFFMKIGVVLCSVILLSMTFGGRAEACTWTGTYLKCGGDLAKFFGGAATAVGKPIEKLAREISKFVQNNTPIPTVVAYKQHLFNNAQGKWNKLPDNVVQAVQDMYPGVDINSVRYAQNVNTIHGQAITLNDRIYFPDSIDLNNKIDLHLMLHELEHVAQYKAKGGETLFLAQYFSDGLLRTAENLFTWKVDNLTAVNIHDNMIVEAGAENKADSIFSEVWVALGHNHEPVPENWCTQFLKVGQYRIEYSGASHVFTIESVGGNNFSGWWYKPGKAGWSLTGDFIAENVSMRFADSAGSRIIANAACGPNSMDGIMYYAVNKSSGRLLSYRMKIR